MIKLYNAIFLIDIPHQYSSSIHFADNQTFSVLSAGISRNFINVNDASRRPAKLKTISIMHHDATTIELSKFSLRRFYWSYRLVRTTHGIRNTFPEIERNDSFYKMRSKNVHIFDKLIFNTICTQYAQYAQWYVDAKTKTHCLSIYLQIQYF